MVTVDDLKARIITACGTQEALARRLDCAKSTISRYLRGGCSYADHRLVSGIASETGLSIEDVYGAILRSPAADSSAPQTAQGAA